MKRNKKDETDGPKRENAATEFPGSHKFCKTGEVKMIDVVELIQT